MLAPVRMTSVRRMSALLLSGAVAAAAFSITPSVAAGLPGSSVSAASAAETGLLRQAEFLDRSPVAVETDDGVYVGWRMLGTDPDEVAFFVYRDGVKITAEPITASTNLLDPDGDASSTYLVTSLLDGIETTATEEFGVWGGQELVIPIDKPADGVTPTGESYTYSAGDGSVGDLDGDGQYEVVMLWSPSNAQDNSRGGYTGPVYVDAYRLDGTRLWRIDLGPNIRAGAHYTQVQVFDYDGDGRAEVLMKTADGTVDGAGTRIGDDSDYRNSNGYVLDGPEYLTLFEGVSGVALDTTAYDPPRGEVSSWGDNYGNRVDRFLAATAYLDGEHPSAIFSRGYYTRTVIAAWDVVDKKLVKRWTFDSTDPQYGPAFEGQGNHNLSVADVDGDQKDEIVFGSLTIDDDGTPLYNTGLGHGDAMHLGDLDPSRPGLEVVSAHENMRQSGNRGATYRDAATGEILGSIPAIRDTGRAAAGDIDPRYAGAEWWAIGGSYAFDSPVGELRASDGTLIGTDIPAANHLVWWTADPLREILDNDFDPVAATGVPTISRWNWEAGTSEVIFRDDEALTINGTKANPVLQADLFGDWREEVIWRSADSTSLRLATTTDVTDLRLRTLMHDPVYRLGVAWQNTAYNQPPHTGFFLGHGMTAPPAPSIRIVGGPTGDGATAPPARATLWNTSGWINGLRDGNFSVSMNLWWGQNASEFRLYENGVLVSVQPLPMATPRAQNAVVNFTGKPNGTYRYTGELRNSRGVTATSNTTVTVTNANPSRPALSSDNWNGRGTFRLTSNLWWGTNATSWTLYENGTAIDTGELTAATPRAQSAVSQIDGRAPGSYTYRVEYTNAAGSTSSLPLVVTVR